MVPENKSEPENKCKCGGDVLNAGSNECKACKKLVKPVDEDVVEPVTVKDDESEAWMNHDPFAEDECNCSNLVNEVCESCRKKRKDADEGCKFKNVSIQTNISEDLADENEGETSMHICEGDGCVCCEEDGVLPLDKSIQVSEILLDMSRDPAVKPDRTQDDNPNVNTQAKDFDEEMIVPGLENNLHHEQDSVLNENCPDCKHPIDYSETLTGRCNCVQPHVKEPAIIPPPIVPPSPFQDNREHSELQKATEPTADSKSTLPDFSDSISNYTDRDTDIRTHITDATSIDNDNDSLANAARLRQGDPLAHQVKLA